MLTRLKVSGFKNLVDVDIHFGPFTCIAGPNGVGKSNLFDAIRLLSALADRTFVDAAKSVRDESGRTGDIKALFHRVGEQTDERMRFEAEMIVPPNGTDDLGQPAKATATFLRYTVELGYRASSNGLGGESLELLNEHLTYIPRSEWKKCLKFPFSDDWRDSAVLFNNRKSPYISTKEVAGERRVLLHRGDGGAPGKTTQRPARQLPRTVLSATNAYESPTALLARREMQSWRLLQLEPSALRKPDEFSAPAQLGWDGAHLPATLFRLAKDAGREGENDLSGNVYGQVAYRLQQLIQDIHTIQIDRDEKRELLSLVATDRRGTPLPARALSDGALRFLALAVLELDPETVGVICFEEPENGIHPARIPAMLELLKNIAMDASMPIGGDNPLRQMIVNTHSPVVVGQVDDDCLLGAIPEEGVYDGQRVHRLTFKALSDTWRRSLVPPPSQLVPNELIAYLDPVPARPVVSQPDIVQRSRPARRVRDRPDIRSLFDDLPADA